MSHHLGLPGYDDDGLTLLARKKKESSRLVYFCAFSRVRTSNKKSTVHAFGLYVWVGDVLVLHTVPVDRREREIGNGILVIEVLGD
jgi:hypothetical protein